MLYYKGEKFVAYYIYPVRNNTPPLAAQVACWVQFPRGCKYPTGISNGIY